MGRDRIEVKKAVINFTEIYKIMRCIAGIDGQKFLPMGGVYKTRILFLR